MYRRHRTSALLAIFSLSAIFCLMNIQQMFIGQPLASDDPANSQKISTKEKDAKHAEPEEDRTFVDSYGDAIRGVRFRLASVQQRYALGTPEHRGFTNRINRTKAKGRRRSVAACPSDPSAPSLWPSGTGKTDDRILRQIQFAPLSLNRSSCEKPQRPEKRILAYYGLPDGVERGNGYFRREKCAVTDCAVTDNHQELHTADAILFQNGIQLPSVRKPTGQVWVLYLLESPMHTQGLQDFRGLINWTATYRRDSTLVTPYAKYVSFPEPRIRSEINYAENKTKLVAWFVSNCQTSNGRLDYVRELQRHLTIDIYGECGSLRCAKECHDECVRMLGTDYKFYLAFENSNCRDYITEKFFLTGLQ